MRKNVTFHLDEKDKIDMLNSGNNCIYLAIEDSSEGGLVFLRTAEQVRQLRDSINKWLVGFENKFEDLVQKARDDGDIVKEAGTGTEADIGKVGPVGPNELDSF